jgi:hypothetical protein
MKRISLWLAVLLLIPALTLWAEPHGGDTGSSTGGSKGFSSPGGLLAAHSNAVRPAPVVINMNHGASGGHNRNFPSQQPAVARQPSYGHVQSR